MAKAFFDSAAGRWTLRQKTEYRGRVITVTGSSRKSRAAAEAAWKHNLLKRRAEIDGEIQAASDKTFYDGLSAWYDLFRRHDGRNSRTEYTDDTTLRQIGAGSLAKIRLSELTAEHVQGYLKSLRPMSTSSIKKIWGMLCPYLRYLGRDDILKRITRPKSLKTTSEKRAYTDEEMRRLTAVLLEMGGVHACALVVCLYEFLRCGELVELRAGDVHDGYLDVRRQYSRVDRQIRQPKYGSARRVPIADEACAVIESAAVGKGPKELLFPGVRIEHLLEIDLLHTLTKACTAAGLPRHTVHDLRHDGISRLVRLGVTPASVSRWCGHKSIATTLRRYYRDDGSENADDLAMVQKENR